MTERNCDTCARYISDWKFKLGGKCSLDDKERSPKSMSGCLGWKEKENVILTSVKRSGN